MFIDAGPLHRHILNSLELPGSAFRGSARRKIGCKNHPAMRDERHEEAQHQLRKASYARYADKSVGVAGRSACVTKMANLRGQASWPVPGGWPNPCPDRLP
jgi:hypothetical protein